LAAAITLAAVIGIAFFIPELQGPQGVVHPEFDSMRRASPAAGSSTVMLGWFFGVVVTILVFLMFSLGVARRGSFRGIGWPLVLVLIATVISWTAVVVAYQGYVSNMDQSLLFGWPLPTALLVFLMFPAMLLINIVFVIYFPKSIMTEEDLDKFERVIAELDADKGA
jgi:hypothetical protein